MPDSGNAVAWKRLGSFSFDSNERSNLQARELKSVTVNVQAKFIKVVLARCHTNSQNVYRQVRHKAHSSLYRTYLLMQHLPSCDARLSQIRVAFSRKMSGRGAQLSGH